MMKKRTLVLAILCVICTSFLLKPALAMEGIAERIDYEDGSYAIVERVASTESRSTTTNSKRYTYYNPYGEKCFQYILYATFYYDGQTSRARSCSGKAVLAAGWSVDSHDEYTSGDTAYGEAVFSGPNGEERSVELFLTCDEDGNVS